MSSPEPQPATSSSAPPAAAEEGSVDDRGSHVVDGWVTASPPKAMEVVQHVLGFPTLVVRNWDLIVTSVQRELSAAFTGTVLGFFWPLLYPVFMFAIYYFIFTKLLAMKMPDLDPKYNPAMGVYMFIGVLVWAAFADALNRGASCIVDNGNLIKKVAFPSEILPLNVVLYGLVTMLFGMFVFLLATAVTPVWSFPAFTDLLWVPVLLLVQLLFAYGLALALATINVFLRDTMQVVAIAVTIWMFLTPLFWIPELIPGIEAYAGLIHANPMYHLVYCWRDVLMGAEPALIFGGNFGRSLSVFSVWAIAVFVLGYTFFTLSRRRFADEV
jgi:lipopolysaccharide transport system permease protein